MAVIPPDELMYKNLELKRQNRFVMYFQDVPAWMIKTAARPQVDIDVIEVHHINTVRKIAGKASWSNIDITMYDPISISGAQATMEWFRQALEPETGRAGYIDQFQRNIQIEIIDPVGTIIEQWTLINAWPASLNYGSLDWSTAEPTEISVTLAFNYATLDF